MISRRTLLKGIVATPLCSGAEKLGACSIFQSTPQQAEVTLNVILHGLFVLQFTKNNMQLMTPYVPLHRYLASGWNPNQLSSMCPESKPFALTGVKTQNIYDPANLKRNLLLSMSKQNFNVDIEHAYLTISLPWPKDIKLLRYATADAATGKKNIFKKPPLNTVTELSLCQALIYPVEDMKKLALTGTSWKPEAVDPSTKTVNLHIWAEPDRQHTLPSHAREAYQRLGELLPPLSFELETADVTAEKDADTGVKGMPPEQEMALSEWIKHGEGSAGSNCGCVMVTD